MPGGFTACLIARVAMSTPCASAFFLASVAASNKGLGAGCHDSAPCIRMSHCITSHISHQGPHTLRLSNCFQVKAVGGFLDGMPWVSLWLARYHGTCLVKRPIEVTEALMTPTPLSQK
jgi:hypothetical protein